MKVNCGWHPNFRGSECHLEAPGEGVALRVEQQQRREALQGRRRGVQALHRDAGVVRRRLGTLQPALLRAVLHVKGSKAQFN
jgi:hypothetical protein